MNLLEKITDKERDMFESWRDNYVLEDACGNVAPLKEILRVWEENKSSLAQLFNGELIIKKDIAVEKGESELSDLMDTAIYGWRSPAYRFASAWNDFFYEKLGDLDYYRDKEEFSKWSDIEKMMDLENLITNTYSGKNYTIVLNDGNELKIQNGCKISKIMGKIAKGYDLPGYEEFRIAHSQALNQKILKGTLTLSIHPLDYITMSDNECGWGSCMSWRDWGEYRQGTVEMMNSPCVVVAYLAATDNMQMGGYEWNSKKWRELFVVSKDIIAGIKGYPYCNTNLEDEVLTWLKELAEKNWHYKYETNICNLEMNDDRYGHVVEKEDISVEFITDIMYNDFYYQHRAILGEEVNSIYLNYSGPSQCMCCGRTDVCFTDSVDLACEECNDVVYCASCGERISKYDAYEVDGEYYCSYCYSELETCSICDAKHVADEMMEIYLCYNGKLYNESRMICYDCVNYEKIASTYHKAEYGEGWHIRYINYIDYDEMNKMTRNNFIKDIFDVSIEEIIKDMEEVPKYTIFAQEADLRKIS